MRFVEMLVVVSAACASLAAAAASAHSRPLGPRSIEQPSWHTLERRSKTGLCTQAYVDNKHSNYCKQTCPLNQVPLFEGGCVCPSPYKSQGKNCVPDCKNGFSINSAKTGCLCREGRVLNVGGSKCLSACTSGSYPVGDGTCASCPAPFAECSSTTIATACDDGFFLTAGQCIRKEDCPAGTFANTSNRRCSPCADKDASSCTDGGPASALACATKFLYGGQCLEASALPDGYYPDPSTLTALPCDAGVKTCSGSGVGHALSCGKNSKGDQLLLTPKGACSLHCPSGWYGLKLYGACFACDSGAKTCDDGGAKTCNDDLYLTPLRMCVSPTQVLPGLYPDAATASFKPCRDGVTACSGPAAGDDLTCGTTSSSVTLYFDALRSTCVKKEDCPASTWANAIDNTCTRCDEDEARCSKNGEGGALECVSGSFLTASDDCLSANDCRASGAFWPNTINKVCSLCDAGEAACDGNGQGLATACAANDAGEQLYLLEGDCVAAELCPSTHFADNDTKACVHCAVGALTCGGLNDAFTCGVSESNKRVYLDTAGDQSGMCVLPANCDKSTYPNPTTKRCEPCSDLDEDATSCTNVVALSCGSLFLQGGACVKASECLPHTFADGVAHECSHCADSDALECTADTSLKCETKFLSAGACVNAERCPAGTFANVDTHECSPCTTKFSDAGTCTADAVTSCTANFLSGGACVSESECPAGTFPSTDSHACLACAVLDSNAATCTKAGGATSCLNELSVYHGSCGRCPDWTYPDGNPSTCRDCWTEWKGASKCTSVTLLACSKPDGYKLYGQKCITTDCPADTTFYDAAANACQPCSVAFPGSVTCSSTRAITCDSQAGYLLWERKGACVKSCPTRRSWEENSIDNLRNTYLVNGVCRDCAESDIGMAVFTCDAQGTPTSCDHWFYYQGGCHNAFFCTQLGPLWVATNDDNDLGSCYQCPAGSNPSGVKGRCD